MSSFERFESGMPVMGVPDVVSLEQRIAEAGTPLLQLMLRAGDALAQRAVEMVGPEATICVLAGSGNNGGDGWVAADLLARQGFSVDVVTRDGAHAIKAKPASTVANMVAGAVAAGELPGLKLHINPDIMALQSLVGEADLVLDCILGTGFAHDDVREPYRSWIEIACAAEAPVLSADVPSGLNAQTGTAAVTCIEAAATVTMIVAKPGLLADSARSFVGELFVASLGVNPADYPA